VGTGNENVNVVFSRISSWKEDRFTSNQDKIDHIFEYISVTSPADVLRFVKFARPSQGGRKKVSGKLLSASSPNIDRFSNLSPAYSVENL